MNKVQAEKLRDGDILLMRSGAKGQLKDGVIYTDHGWRFHLYQYNIQENGCLFDFDNEVVDRIVKVIRAAE